jgi:pilus assembly protein CpaE
MAALLLNLSFRNTWAHLANVPAEGIDNELLDSLLLPHPSGASVLAAPHWSKTSELLTVPKISRVLKLLAARYPYVVLDLPHDFLDATLAGLDAAQQIVAMMTPEDGALAGMRTMMQAFEEMDYPRDRVRLVLNHVFARNGLKQKRIEEVLKRPFDMVIPFTPEAVAAINLGTPLVLSAPDSPVGALLEDFAFQVSKEEHRSQPPAEPTKAFQRVTRRLGPRQQKGLRRFFA